MKMHSRESEQPRERASGERASGERAAGRAGGRESGHRESRRPGERAAGRAGTGRAGIGRAAVCCHCLFAERPAEEKPQTTRSLSVSESLIRIVCGHIGY